MPTRASFLACSRGKGAAADASLRHMDRLIAAHARGSAGKRYRKASTCFPFSPVRQMKHHQLKLQQICSWPSSYSHTGRACKAAGYICTGLFVKRCFWKALSKTLTRLRRRHVHAPKKRQNNELRLGSCSISVADPPSSVLPQCSAASSCCNSVAPASGEQLPALCIAAATASTASWARS